MTTYLILNADGLVINVIVWDGITDYNPDEGQSLMAYPTESQGVWVGWTFTNGEWVAPVEPEPTEQE